MIFDGERLSEQLLGERLGPAEYLQRAFPAAQIPPLDHCVLTASPLTARVNHGVWIASCPCGAKGEPTPGGVVFAEAPLVFCLRCGNQATGHGWRPVVVPTETVRNQIEMVLDCRPNVADQNWEPDETIDDLLEQNRAHGDPLPDLAVAGPLHGPLWPIAAPFGQRFRAELGPRWWQKLLGRR